MKTTRLTIKADALGAVVQHNIQRILLDGSRAAPIYTVRSRVPMAVGPALVPRWGFGGDARIVMLGGDYVITKVAVDTVRVSRPGYSFQSTPDADTRQRIEDVSGSRIWFPAERGDRTLQRRERIERVPARFAPASGTPHELYDGVRFSVSLVLSVHPASAGSRAGALTSNYIRAGVSVDVNILPSSSCEFDLDMSVRSYQMGTISLLVSPNQIGIIDPSGIPILEPLTQSVLDPIRQALDGRTFSLRLHEGSQCLLEGANPPAADNAAWNFRIPFLADILPSDARVVNAEMRVVGAEQLPAEYVTLQLQIESGRYELEDFTIPPIDSSDPFSRVWARLAEAQAGYRRREVETGWREFFSRDPRLAAGESLQLDLSEDLLLSTIATRVQGELREALAEAAVSSPRLRTLDIVRVGATRYERRRNANGFSLGVEADLNWIDAIGPFDVRARVSAMIQAGLRRGNNGLVEAVWVDLGVGIDFGFLQIVGFMLLAIGAIALGFVLVAVSAAMTVVGIPGILVATGTTRYTFGELLSVIPRMITGSTIGRIPAAVSAVSDVPSSLMSMARALESSLNSSLRTIIADPTVFVSVDISVNLANVFSPIQGRISLQGVDRLLDAVLGRTSDIGEYMTANPTLLRPDLGLAIRQGDGQVGIAAALPPATALQAAVRANVGLRRTGSAGTPFAFDNMFDIIPSLAFQRLRGDLVSLRFVLRNLSDAYPLQILAVEIVPAAVGMALSRLSRAVLPSLAPEPRDTITIPPYGEFVLEFRTSAGNAEYRALFEELVRLGSNARVSLRFQTTGGTELVELEARYLTPAVFYDSSIRPVDLTTSALPSRFGRVGP